MGCAYCQWVYGAYITVGSMKWTKISKTRILGHGTTNMELQPENDQDRYNRRIKSLELCQEGVRIECEGVGCPDNSWVGWVGRNR